MRQGFTLIEVLIVVAIIAIVSSVVMVRIPDVLQSSRINTLLGQAAQMDRALALDCVRKFDFEIMNGVTTYDGCSRGEGTIAGAVAAEGVDGNAAAHFDGVDDYVGLGNFDITNDELTISAWFRADSWTNGAYHDGRIVDKSFNHFDNGIYWMLSTIAVGNETRLRFRLRTNGGMTVLIADSGNIKLDTWYLATAVYDGDEMRLYLDSTPVGSTPKNGTINSDPTSPVRIGNSSDLVRPWSGSIDNVRIYSRAAYE